MTAAEVIAALWAQIKERLDGYLGGTFNGKEVLVAIAVTLIVVFWPRRSQ